MALVDIGPRFQEDPMMSQGGHSSESGADQLGMGNLYQAMNWWPSAGEGGL